MTATEFNQYLIWSDNNKADVVVTKTPTKINPETKKKETARKKK